MQKQTTFDHEEGQFDDAPDDSGKSVNAAVTNGLVPSESTSTPVAVVDSRQGGSYIDDEEKLLEWSDVDYEGEDDEEALEEDIYDDRIEDEDWDIAERGMYWHRFITLSLSFNTLECRFYKTVQPPEAARRSAVGDSSRQPPSYVKNVIFRRRAPRCQSPTPKALSPERSDTPFRWPRPGEEDVRPARGAGKIRCAAQEHRLAVPDGARCECQPQGPQRACEHEGQGGQGYERAGARPAHAHHLVQDDRPRARTGDQRLREHWEGGL